jgi:hypothetical protein
MRHLLAVVALAVVLAPAVQADPPADKGKGNPSSQGKSKDTDTYDPYADRYDDRYDDGGKDKDKDKSKDNHGQRVSECNHRANERKLKGNERKDYVEWCVDRGDRYKYDDRSFDRDRSCYRKADDKGLSGGFRQAFLADCFKQQDRKR